MATNDPVETGCGVIVLAFILLMLATAAACTYGAWRWALE